MNKTSQEDQHEEPSKKSIWNSIFSALGKMKIKKSVTRAFIFHPPRIGYEFQEISRTGQDIQYKFALRSLKRIVGLDKVDYVPYILQHQRKKNRIYKVPLLHVILKKNPQKYFQSSRALIRKELNPTNQLVIYSHGNASDLGTSYVTAYTLADLLNTNAICYDYTGYGIAGHKPSEKNTYFDAEAVISFAVYKLGYSLENITLVGFSVGTGPTVEMGVRYPWISRICLFAPLASCAHILEKKDKSISTQHNMFTNNLKVKKLNADLLIIHGDKDKVIPDKHGQMLYDNYVNSHPDRQNNRVWFIKVDGAGHNELLQNLSILSSDYSKTVRQYLGHLMNGNKKDAQNIDSDSILNDHYIFEEVKNFDEDNFSQTSSQGDNSSNNNIQKNCEKPMMKAIQNRLLVVYDSLLINKIENKPIRGEDLVDRFT